MLVPRGAAILMIEDDKGLVRAVKRQLIADGLRIRARSLGAGAVEELLHSSPEIVLLDLMIPDVDGLELLQKIRPATGAQIIVLAPQDDEQTKVAALDAGADDCITKPFSMGELEARIRVALRHFAGRPREATLTAGDLTLDVARHAVTAAGVPVHLTPREFSLCRLLLQHQGRVVGTAAMVESIWGKGASPRDTHIVRTFISQLRAKLGHVVRIVNESGVGYRLRPVEAAGELQCSDVP